jgi:hypothetical protein
MTPEQQAQMQLLLERLLRDDPAIYDIREADKFGYFKEWERNALALMLQVKGFYPMALEDFHHIALKAGAKHL